MPAEASSIWQRLPSDMNFTMTQRFTLAMVGEVPMHSRRTSCSQAARASPA